MDDIEATALISAAGLVRQPDGHGGHGLFASKPLTTGFELRIPRDAVFSAMAAAATELGARLLQATPQFTDEELCICVLAEARRYPGASRFSAYAARLPYPAPDVASWTAAAIALIDGTDLGAAVAEIAEGMADLAVRLGPLLSEHRPLVVDDLLWARGTLLSRRFRAGNSASEATDAAAVADVGGGASSGGGGAPTMGATGVLGWLLPVLDEPNHCPDATAELVFEADAVVLRNRQPLAPGDQAFNNYGNYKSNEELLAMYGFAQEANPADCVALLVCPVSGSEPGDDPEPIRLTIDRHGISMDLWQVLVGDADDDAAEMLAVDGLNRLLVSKLEALDDTEPDPALAGEPEPDESSAQTAIEPRQRDYVRWYRAGLREVLESAINECTTMGDMLMTAPDDEGDSEEDDGGQVLWDHMPFFDGQADPAVVALLTAADSGDDDGNVDDEDGEDDDEGVAGPGAWHRGDAPADCDDGDHDGIAAVAAQEASPPRQDREKRRRLSPGPPAR